MALHQEEERICRELGNKDGLQRSLGSQALILRLRGDLDGAMALHQEEGRICRELGNKNSLAISLINQALILRERGRVDVAMDLLREAEDLCRQCGYASSLGYGLYHQASLLHHNRGQPQAALPLAEEALGIFTHLNMPGMRDHSQTLLSAIQQTLSRTAR